MHYIRVLSDTLWKWLIGFSSWEKWKNEVSECGADWMWAARYIHSDTIWIAWPVAPRNNKCALVVLHKLPLYIYIMYNSWTYHGCIVSSFGRSHHLCDVDGACARKQQQRQHNAMILISLDFSKIERNKFPEEAKMWRRQKFLLKHKSKTRKTNKCRPTNKMVHFRQRKLNEFSIVCETQFAFSRSQWNYINFYDLSNLFASHTEWMHFVHFNGAAIEKIVWFRLWVCVCVCVC